MKVTRIEGVTSNFKPITIAITLESVEEVQALHMATANLTASEIESTIYTKKDRVIWSDLLAAIGYEL